MYFKDKVTEQSALISKLLSKETLLRKRYHDEMIRIIRSKNILNIHSSFEKEVEGTFDGKNLLNVNGRTYLNSSKGKNLNQSLRSSESFSEINHSATIRAKKVKTAKNTESSQRLRRYEPKNYSGNS
jgi:hypothetical protein